MSGDWSWDGPDGKRVKNQTLKPHPRTSTAIKFSADTHARLREAADAHGLSMNFIVVKAVEELLANIVEPEQLRLTNPQHGFVAEDETESLIFGQPVRPSDETAERDDS